MLFNICPQSPFCGSTNCVVCIAARLNTTVSFLISLSLPYGSSVWLLPSSQRNSAWREVHHKVCGIRGCSPRALPRAVSSREVNDGAGLLLAPKHPWTERQTDLLSLLHRREMPFLISHLVCNHYLENFEVCCLYAMIRVRVLLRRGLQEHDIPDQHFLQLRGKCWQSGHFIFPGSCAVVNAEDLGVQEACFSFELPFQEVARGWWSPRSTHTNQRYRKRGQEELLDRSKEGGILLSTTLLWQHLTETWMYWWTSYGNSVYWSCQSNARLKSLRNQWQHLTSGCANVNVSSKYPVIHAGSGIPLVTILHCHSLAKQ